MVAAAKLLRPTGRRRTGLFLAEGPNLVEAALRRGVVTDVFATESALDRFRDLLGAAPVHLVTEKAAKALSETRRVLRPGGAVIFNVSDALPHNELADAV